MKPLYAVIASGDLVSGTVDCTQVRAIRAIAVPGMTSGDLGVQGALDSTSASFARFIETRTVPSSDLRFNTGPGSRFIAWPFGEVLPPYLRLESLVAQTSPRTLTLLTR